MNTSSASNFAPDTALCVTRSASEFLSANFGRSSLVSIMDGTGRARYGGGTRWGFCGNALLDDLLDEVLL
jgi:hypothetical protein